MRLIDITPLDNQFYKMDDLPHEVWKDVVGCEGYYVCSNYSRIKTLPRNGVRRGGRILKPSLKNDGYYQVCLKVCGRTFYKRVNRIIAEAFVPNPDKKPICDHIDNNVLNNKSTNLQWLTSSENTKKYIREVYDGKYVGRGSIKPKLITAVKDGCSFKFKSMFQCAIVLFGNKNTRAGISKACRTGKYYRGWLFKCDVPGGDV